MSDQQTKIQEVEARNKLQQVKCVHAVLNQLLKKHQIQMPLLEKQSLEHLVKEFDAQSKEITIKTQETSTQLLCQIWNSATEAQFDGLKIEKRARVDSMQWLNKFGLLEP
jgi:molybdopterin-guanine dinucleotide biosynthesis protein A